MSEQETPFLVRLTLDRLLNGADENHEGFKLKRNTALGKNGETTIFDTGKLSAALKIASELHRK